MSHNLTPVPSSDAPEPEDETGQNSEQLNGSTTPSRRVSLLNLVTALRQRHVLIRNWQAKKAVKYVESDSEGEDDDEAIFRPTRKAGVSGKTAKRRKTSPESEDDFKEDGDAGYSDDGRP